jgi:hypothetical protein
MLSERIEKGKNLSVSEHLFQGEFGVAFRVFFQRKILMSL